MVEEEVTDNPLSYTTSNTTNSENYMNSDRTDLLQLTTEKATPRKVKNRAPTDQDPSHPNGFAEGSEQLMGEEIKSLKASTPGPGDLPWEDEPPIASGFKNQ